MRLCLYGTETTEGACFSSVFVHVQTLGSAPLMIAAPKYISILAHTYNTALYICVPKNFMGW